MKLDEALEHLDAIKSVANRSNTFEGLRAFPTALTSLVAIAAACLQSGIVAQSTDPTRAFLMLWVSVAAIALVIVLADMVLRYYRDPTARERRMTLDVLARLSPAIIVGASITTVVFFTAIEIAWVLPGLWAALLGMGVFAASSLLPSSLQKVGIWYIGCGLAVLILGQGDWVMHPLTMAIPFGGGQVLAAGLMHINTANGEAI
ncbi:hypothetical protein [Planctomycetes bacterium K23_9]|uniref:Uncharacterized protein n=1 Tax=Stieleria marina TaxID=1930275 RepID=A0A517NQ36_9BACT|nr:hypothetical protein K239x_11750 [Planctomycetes bacterium K23_9]